MAREHLSARGNWQAMANDDGRKAEDVVFAILRGYLREQSLAYEIEEKPKLAKEIYDGQWGIVPEISIKNGAANRTALIEVKRQNAAGNAHERAGKYFAPGIRERLQKICNSEDRYPVFFIFTNGIASDPKYRAELTTWFDAPDTDPTIQNHLLIWENRVVESLLEFFDNSIKPFLDG